MKENIITSLVAGVIFIGLLLLIDLLLKHLQPASYYAVVGGVYVVINIVLRYCTDHNWFRKKK